MINTCLIVIKVRGLSELNAKLYKNQIIERLLLTRNFISFIIGLPINPGDFRIMDDVSLLEENIEIDYG